MRSASGVTGARAGSGPAGSVCEPAGRLAAETAVVRQRRSRRIGRSLRNGGHRAPHRRHCLRRDQELVGIGELRVSDPAAMVAAKLPGPAFGRPQACHFDAIGCSAVWTDDQHWRIGNREKRIRGP